VLYLARCHNNIAENPFSLGQGTGICMKYQEYIKFAKDICFEGASGFITLGYAEKILNECEW